MLVLLVGLVGIMAAKAPAALEARIERRLSAAWGGPVEVERVTVSWSGPTITAHGLRFEDGVRLEVEVERLELELVWSELLRGDSRPAITVHGPRGSLEARAAPDRERPAPEPSEFESLTVTDGALEVTLETTGGPVLVSLTEIQAQVDPRVSAGGSSAMDLAVHLEGSLGAEGRVRIDGRVSSRAPAEAWSAAFELERFELSSLNRLWLDIIEMDVDHGYLSLDGHLTRSPSRVHGRIRPRFEEISMLGAGEEALHPMAEALFGHMLMGARSTIPIDRPVTEDQGSSLSELVRTDWKTIIQDVIRHGYARRLSKLEGFRASIGDVRVDFSRGMLQLLGVRLELDEPLIDIPFASIERIDVVFDPEVADSRARAYKHVTLWRPTLTFASGLTGAETQITFDDTWIDTISAIPFKTRDLLVHEGRVELWDFRGEEPLNISITEIELVGEEMATDLHPMGGRGARIAATGWVLDQAQASLDILYEPRMVVPNVGIKLQLDSIDLRSLAPALQVFADVDPVSGRVGFAASIDAHDYRVNASVVPDVFRPKIRTFEGRHMLRRFIIERALRRLQSRSLELNYSMDPGEGVLHEFFTELIKGIFRGNRQ